jgi:hypothetical protein
MSVGLGGTWVWGQWDMHATIHGVWVCNERRQYYIAKILLHLHKALCDFRLVCSMAPLPLLNLLFLTYSYFNFFSINYTPP